MVAINGLQTPQPPAPPDLPEPVPRTKLGRGAWVLLCATLVVQALQVALHLFSASPVFASDFLQGIAALITAAVCYYKACRDRHFRQLWMGLFAAFTLWTAAQLYYAFAALRPGITNVLFSDILWIIYAFPMLLVTLYTPHTSRRDPASWFDAAQAGIFFTILLALIFPAPGIISQALSDDVQAVAMLLALILRYCVAEPGRERLFFRNLTAYMAVYLFGCFVYYIATTHGFAIGSIFEVCWSLPFTFFSVLALCTDLTRLVRVREPEKNPVTARERFSRPAPASYIKGASALGLAIMSMTASAVLAYHRPIQGGIALAVAFVLFAARTSAREWQLHSAHSRLNHSVMYDPLTSVANRTQLDSEITRRLAAPGSNESQSTVVLFVGLDRFKTLNDCLGHAFGDLLLQRVADLLLTSIRKQDLVARYGGDEFVILLDRASAREAGLFASRALDLLKQPLSLEGRLLNVTASIGYTSGTASTTAAEMLQQAHFAMHHAKKAGRDRAQAFEADMVRIPQYRLALETDLRKTLAEDGISVFYQPIFSVESGKIVGFEALARWQHPERGYISPMDFIAVAEDTGLIIQLGQQILRKACTQCREWNQHFGQEYTMNVNVSAHQFASPQILSQIVSTLFETGLEARFLKLEITESVLISGYSCVEEVLRKAQQLGIQLCLDDFGTGYSSLSYLLNYPFDIVKIDQSFVRNLDQDPRRADVVRTLVDLASSLRKHLVAEGVERAEEMACLKDLRCELAQGYLLSRPLPVEAATALLEAHRQTPEGVSIWGRGERESRAFLLKSKIAEPAA